MHFYYAWKNGGHQKKFTTGVSLHGHTADSRESLAFLPVVIQQTYFLPSLLRVLEKNYRIQYKTKLDYAQGYWTSPVPTEAAYILEEKQIIDQGLMPLVSITNHDEISACKNIISLEWTAPYNQSVFHVGIHNLPKTKSAGLLKQLHRATEEHNNVLVREALAAVAAHPGTLIVLNHPLTDQGRIGQSMLAELAEDFMTYCKPYIHALEINALQPWAVNQRVIKLAEKWSLPLVAGGDRHGFEPSGAINLTNAKTFKEFAREVRDEKKSVILFMPQFRKSIAIRYGHEIEDIMATYPTLGKRARWHDRVFYMCPDGVTRSVTEMTGKNSRLLTRTKHIVTALELANLVAKPLGPAFAKIRSASL